MPETNLSAPSALDYGIYNKTQRESAGVGTDYRDTYNTAAQNDYQLALQEYLYNKYQSPAAMARQYEEAGLNRNFASTNSRDIHSPSNSYRSNVSESEGRRVSNTLATINSVLGLISTGVDTVSQLTNLPKDLAFKEWRNVAAGFDADIASNKAIQELMKAYYAQSFYGGVKFEPWDVNGQTFDVSGSPAMQQALSRNELMSLKVALADYDLNNIKPSQLKQINETIDNIAQRTSFLGLQEDTYYQLKSMGLLAPIIVSLLKML